MTILLASGLIRIIFPTQLLLYDIVFYTNSFPQSSNSSRTWLDELRCLGTESRLINCPANTIGDEDCTHTQDVALVCTACKLDDQIQIYYLASVIYSTCV